MTRAAGYVIAWASGHQPPRTVYFRGGKKTWGATYERDEAARFRTRTAARRMWESKHRFPENYHDEWQSGVLRVEPTTAPMLPFCHAHRSES